MPVTNFKKDFFIQNARVVELVDTRDLKSLDRNIVPVQVRPRVPLTNLDFYTLYLYYKCYNYSHLKHLQ